MFDHIILFKQMIKTLNMTTFEFQTQILQMSDFIEGFALKFTRNEENAKDLAQDTILKAFKNKDKFAPNTNLKGWLMIMMRNIFINGVRKKSNKMTTYNSDDWKVINGETDYYSPHNILGTKEIMKIINGLPDDLRVPFYRHYEGFKYQEIADELGLPLGTVKSRIFQARKLLAAKLTDLN